MYRLFGYAGTGKTTIAKYLAGSLDGDVVYAAFTGKAALMMRQHGCEGATTIHSLIYKGLEKPDGSIRFRRDPDSSIVDAELIVLDECSMVGTDLARDLMSFGIPILALGDPAQLPPVEGRGFFTDAKPDSMLTEIHRQAKDSPVLRLSTDVREGKALEYGTYGTSRVVANNSLSLDEVLAADQLLVGRNVTRHHFNREIREALGRINVMPEIGDRLVCLCNDHGLGIFKLGLFSVVSTPQENKYRKALSMAVNFLDFPETPNVRINVRPEFFTQTDNLLDWKELLRTQHFGYGYALTTHKAQGSQWGNVIIEDESHVFRAADRQRWLYTAITRASERVTIVT